MTSDSGPLQKQADLPGQTIAHMGRTTPPVSPSWVGVLRTSMIASRHGSTEAAGEPMPRRTTKSNGLELDDRLFPFARNVHALRLRHVRMRLDVVLNIHRHVRMNVYIHI